MRLLFLAFVLTACATHAPATRLEIIGAASPFAPAATTLSDLRLTLSPDGNTALWFSRNRPGGAGGYDIWMARRHGDRWSEAAPAPFNSPSRDFDPAFSADGRFVYFCSDRAGSLGGDDIYRVAVTDNGFGAVEHLGSEVNTAANEWAPMLSPNGATLLFASNREDGAGRFDLYVAQSRGSRFAPAAGLPGDVNTAGDEFDATFLSDSRTIVFSRARSMQTDRIDLVLATSEQDRYRVGAPLPLGVNDAVNDTYAPMLDWSAPNQLTFSGKRSEANGMDVFVVRYRLT